MGIIEMLTTCKQADSRVEIFFWVIYLLLTRYEFVINNENRIGILVGLDELFNIDEVLSLGWIFERDLKLPDIPMTNTKSYFTEKGNRKFRKAIREIKRVAASKNIEIVCEKIDISSLNEILYIDEYQVITVLNRGLTEYSGENPPRR